MKKVVCLLVSLWFLCSCAFAAEMEYGSLSAAELQEVIQSARNALLAKTARDEGKVFIVDLPDDIQIYLTGEISTNWRGEYELEVVVINNSDTDVSISFDNVIINGWETDTFGVLVASVSAGSKKKHAITLKLEDTDISVPEKIEDIRITFHTFDPSTFTTIRKYGPYTVYYDGQNWSR